MPFTDTWNVSYEAIPADNEDIDLGANRIRDLKVAVRERLAVDHSWAGDANDGLHLHCEFVPQGGAPALVNAADGVVYTQSISGATELLYKDSAGRITQITARGGLGGTVAGNLQVGGSSLFVGEVDLEGQLNVGGRTYFAANEDLGFYADTDASHNHFINFAPNCYITFNAADSSISIVINSVQVAHWP